MREARAIANRQPFALWLSRFHLLLTPFNRILVFLLDLSSRVGSRTSDKLAQCCLNSHPSGFPALSSNHVIN
jgi:hypothetical protein